MLFTCNGRLLSVLYRPTSSQKGRKEWVSTIKNRYLASIPGGLGDVYHNVSS